MKPTLTLIIPGLGELSMSESLSSCTSLHKLTSRAELLKTNIEGYEQSLMNSLGYAVPSRSELPAAQCTYLTDFNESAGIHCARADPVHLRAEQDHGRLVSADSLELSAEESDTIVEDLNNHFAEDDLYFSIGQRDRWYVSGKRADNLDSAPTSVVAGKNVATFLPLSVDASAWRQLSTEVQMFLHTHPVNAKRESRGLMPVNALWFWGAGKISSRNAVGEYRLFSNTAFALGLASLSGMTTYPLQDIQSALTDRSPALLEGNVSNVIVLDTGLLETILSGDMQLQSELLLSLDKKLFNYANRLLKNGSIKQIVIDTCAGQQFQISRLQLFRFWARQSGLVVGQSNSEQNDRRA